MNLQCVAFVTVAEKKRPKRGQMSSLYTNMIPANSSNKKLRYICNINPSYVATTRMTRKHMSQKQLISRNDASLPDNAVGGY